MLDYRGYDWGFSEPSGREVVGGRVCEGAWGDLHHPRCLGSLRHSRSGRSLAPIYPGSHIAPMVTPKSPTKKRLTIPLETTPATRRVVIGRPMGVSSVLKLCSTIWFFLSTGLMPRALSG